MRDCPLHQWSLHGTSARLGSSCNSVATTLESVLSQDSLSIVQQLLNQTLPAIPLPQDLFDDYFCLCDGGYFGRNCELEINECAPGPCQNGATCVDLIADYRCDCLQDYTVGEVGEQGLQ